MVASLSVKAEIRAMTQGICELMVEDHLRRLEDQVGWTYETLLWQ